MDMETQIAIADNLRYLRNIFGYTQMELSDKIHICRSTYATYENGTKIPGTETIFNLAKLYNISVDTILDCHISKFLNNLIFIEDAHDSLRELVSIFHDLSPSGRVCLVEKADSILQEEQETKRQYKKELPGIPYLIR